MCIHPSKLERNHSGKMCGEMTSTGGSGIVSWCGIHLIRLSFKSFAQSSSDSLRGIESIGEAVYHG